jgi:hypothetical protein
MRINGRNLRPSTLGERRLLKSLGMDSPVRVPRTKNPFQVARQLRSLANNTASQIAELRSMLSRPRPSKAVTPQAASDEQTNGGV